MSQLWPWIIKPAIEPQFGASQWNILCVSVKYLWQLEKFPFWQIVLTSKCCRPTFLRLRWCGIGAFTNTYQTAHTTSIMFSSSYPWNFTKSVTYAAAQRTHADNDIRIDTTVQMKINKKIFFVCVAVILLHERRSLPTTYRNYSLVSCSDHLMLHTESVHWVFLYIQQSGRKLKEKCDLFVLLLSSVFFSVLLVCLIDSTRRNREDFFFNFSSGFRLQKFPNNKILRFSVENFRELDIRLIVEFVVWFPHQKSELTHPKCRRHF